jgi:single-strand DNA-binding protein
MGSMNKVILLGRLGDDPVSRSMPDGSPVANFDIATSTFSSKSGEKKEYTEWHKCCAFNQAAEVASQYLKKGSQVLIEGSLRTNKWEDKEGNKRSTVEIVVGRLTMVGGRPESASEPLKASSNTSAKPAAQKAKAGDFDDIPDDYPF